MLVKDTSKTTSSKVYAEIDLSSLEKIVKSISALRELLCK